MHSKEIQKRIVTLTTKVKRQSFKSHRIKYVIRRATNVNFITYRTTVYLNDSTVNMTETARRNRNYKSNDISRMPGHENLACV